jgi:hypothetical protein
MISSKAAIMRARRRLSIARAPCPTVRRNRPHGIGSQSLALPYDDLSRENLLKQATNLKGFHPSLFIDGVNLSTSPSDRTPWQQARMARFDGTSWVPFGDVVTIENDKQN